MSTIRFKIKDIKTKIKKESNNYWFYVTPKKSILIAKGNSKSEAKNIVKEKIKNKPDKYKGQILRRLFINFHNEKKILSSGTLRILVTNYKIINGKLKEIFLEGKGGPVWFTKEWLNWYGWNKKYIVKITEDLRKNKTKISGIGSNMYDREFKN